MKFRVIQNDRVKILRSENFNYNFDKLTGYTQTFGRTKENDVKVWPFPLIADIEISTSCNRNCIACYKGNSSLVPGKNMSLATFKTLMSKFPKTKKNTMPLQSIAFGIGGIGMCIDLFNIMDYTRNDLGVIPCITVNGKNITDKEITQLANVCGAVAVSHYSNKDCFNTIYRLTEAKKEKDATLQQVNIHKILSSESFNSCVELLSTINENKHLKSCVNAVVFLSIKPKGPRNILTPVSNEYFIADLFNLAEKYEIGIGADSCSAPGILRWSDRTNRPGIKQFVQPCEATLESSYFSVDGGFYPCSFAEGIGEWKEGINALEIEDFYRDLWFHPRVNEWRKKLLNTPKGCHACPSKNECRSCPIFSITPCKQ